jgi:hypothetical protein
MANIFENRVVPSGLLGGRYGSGQFPVANRNHPSVPEDNGDGF